MTAVLGAIGTGAAFVSVVVLHPEARIVGTGWMIAGMAGYLLYRRRQGLDPRRHTGCAVPSGRSTSSRSPTTRRWCRSSGPSVDTDAMAARGRWSTPMRRSRPFYVLKVPRAAAARRRASRGGARGPPRARGGTPAGQGRRLQGALPADPGAQPGARDRRRGQGAALGPDLHLAPSTPRARSACSARPRATCWPTGPAASSSSTTPQPTRRR